MNLTSPAFSNNGTVPGKYTCDGLNIGPPLEFSDVPEKAKSLVLIMDDPDIPDFVKEKCKINVWDNWVVFNILPKIRKIPEGQNPPGILGKNTSGKNGYGGPCPPDKEHRYFFKLYALDTTLDLKEGATKEQVEKAMQEHVVEKEELVGRYEKKR